MKLTCFKLVDELPEIRPAPFQREWMDNTREKFAYRCLPLTIANSEGWEMLCPVDFTAEWDGSDGFSAIHIVAEGARHLAPISHFGAGILTFHVNVLFKTEPGYNLYVTGPVNEPKDGIQALTGIVETDWSPYTFTMNWKFTRKNTQVCFWKGEPFCFFFPVPRGLNESIETEVRRLDEDPELAKSYGAWQQSRDSFISTQRKTRESGWQKDYYHGKQPSGEHGIPEHQIKIKLRPFKETT